MHAVINSIKGYWKLIDLLQLWHFPCWIIYVIIGIFLYSGIFILHFGQIDRDKVTDIPLGVLYANTFIKLPIINPKTIIVKSRIIKFIYLYYPRAEPNWKIGKYVTITIAPITTPTNTINRGSIIEVNLSTVAATCFA